MCDRKKSFIWQEIWKYFKYAAKQRELLQKFHVSVTILWEPGSLVPGEYPTLVGNVQSETGQNLKRDVETKTVFRILFIFRLCIYPIMFVYTN